MVPEIVINIFAVIGALTVASTVVTIAAIIISEVCSRSNTETISTCSLTDDYCIRPDRTDACEDCRIYKDRRENQSMKIKVKLDEGAYMPVKAHADDAGWDLRLPGEEPVLVRLGGAAVIDTGVHIEIPTGYVGFLKSKSGLNVKKGIVSEGVIDAGYTGSIVVKLYNLDENSAVQFRPGDKITQLVILPIPEVELAETDLVFADTERGNNGFGSSGR